MKHFLFIVLLLSYLSLVSGIYDNVPDCAVPCIYAPLDLVACEPSNTTCLCQDMNYNMAVIHCIRVECGVEEALNTKNQTWQDCGFQYHDENGLIAWVPSVLFALVTVFFAARLAIKWMALSTWGWDDWTILFAYVLMIAFLAATILGRQNGFGQDIWTLSVKQITTFVKGFFAFELLYFMTLALIKASILFLYLRIFGTTSDTFRKILYGTHVFNIAVCVAFILANVNQCKPLSYFWDGWDATSPGYCVNLSAMTLSHASLNIAIDVWMLVLPITQVYRLNLQKRQKAGIISMFGFGILITVVSVVRLKTISVFNKSWNPTYDFFGLALWSHTELCVGMMVACMPAARTLARRLFPELLYVTNISQTRQSTRASANVKIVSLGIETIVDNDTPPESSASTPQKPNYPGSIMSDRVPLKRLMTSDSYVGTMLSEPSQCMYDGSPRGRKCSH